MHDSTQNALARWAPPAILVACILTVHASSLTGPARLTAHHDNLDGAAPLRMQAAEQWKNGQVPLWNPFKRGGMPLLADTTAGAIYPGNIPFLFVATPAQRTTTTSDDSPVFRAMDEVALLHALLAGLFTFLFLRTMGLAAASSVLGGLLFACNGTTGWFAAWYIQIQNSVVWLPLILAAVHRTAVAEASTPAWIAIGATAVALQFFAGYPETGFYSALIAIGYALAVAPRGRWWRAPAAVAAIYAAGLLLAAVQLFPSIELESLSRRPGELTLEMFQSLPASASMFRAWLLPSGAPGLEFPPAAAYHFGAAAVLAAAAGLAGRTRRGFFFGALLVVGTLLSLGAATPVNAWAHLVPGLNAFRHPFKHLFEVSFAMSVLAALGAERVLSSRTSPSRWREALVAAATLWCTLSLHQNQAALLAANPASVDTSGRAPSLLAGIEPGWRVLTPRQLFQTRSPDFLLGDYPSQFDVLALHGAGPYLWSELADATGMIEEETTFRRGLFDAGDHTLALLACRYFIEDRSAGGFAANFDPSVYRVVRETGEARLLERKGALPRVRFVGDVRCSDAQTIATALAGDIVDPAVTALVTCSADSRPGKPLAAASTTSAEIIDESPGHLSIRTRVPDDARGFLVVSQADFPGWRARADGNPVPLRRVFGLLQGIEVPPATKLVELTYAPWPFRVGAATSAVTALLLFGWVMASRRRSR